MNIASLIVQLVSGAAGGNDAGSLLQKVELGTGGAGAAAGAAAASGLDLGSILASVAGGGVGGGAPTAIAGLLLSRMANALRERGPLDRIQERGRGPLR